MNSAFTFENDKPEIRHDYLGYRLFAGNIKRSLDSLPSELGFSCALDGIWGIGKTTLINFIKEEIKKDVNSKYKIIDFSPWNIIDEQNLINEFFALLQKNIEDEKSDLRIEKVIQSYYQIIIEGVKLLPSVSKFTSFLDILSSHFFKKETKTLSSVKTELYDYMRYEYTGKDLLVIIDDVDRLSGKEIMNLMKLIKEIADFPHITYLLSLDKNNVAKAINLHSNFTEDNDYGYSYLDKFVQLWWSMPVIGEYKLMEYLQGKIIHLVGQDIFEADKLYFEEICKKIIFYRDEITLRKIKLLCNSFTINYAKMSSYTNFCDLLAYTWIQLFYPDLLAFIIQNVNIMLLDEVTERDLLLSTSSTEKEKIEQDNMEKNKARIEIAFPKEHIDEYNQILSTLFPPYFKNCINRYSTNYKDNAIMRLLICTYENFSNYIYQTENDFIFLLRKIESTLKEKDTNKIVDFLNEKNKEIEDLVKYLQLYYLYKKDGSYLFNLIQALFIFGNTKDENENHFLIGNILDYFVNLYDSDAKARYKSLQPIIETIKETNISLIDKFLVCFLHSFIVSQNLLINFEKTEQDSLIGEFAIKIKKHNYSLNNDFYYQRICHIFNHVGKYEYLKDLFYKEIKFVLAYIIITAEKISNQNFISFQKHFSGNNSGIVFNINTFWQEINPELAKEIISLSPKIKAFTSTSDYSEMKTSDRNIIDSYCREFSL